MNIYLDNSASTPLDTRVTKAMFEWSEQHLGNPSSIHSAGRKTKNKIEQVRDLLARKLSCSSKEITFTSGGTESNNLALIGSALANRFKGNHLILSATEHPSVLNSTRFLTQNGFEIDFVKPDSNGTIQLENIESLFREATILVSVMYVNNETGAIFPVQEIAELCCNNHILYHCDGVQAFGKIPFSVQDIPVDLLSISAHKIYGPAGMGALFIRSNTIIEPLLLGGGQESNRRAGTENVQGIVGFGMALKILNESLEFAEKVQKLKDAFETQIRKEVPDTIILAEQTQRSPYISLLSFPGISNDTLLMALDMAGIAASAGSACSSGSIARSHVLEAMNLPEDVIDSAVRFSFSKYTTTEEISVAIEKLKQIVNELYQKKIGHEFHRFSG